ncbi:MAG: hypothetical protein GWO11_00460, partial [Desulfuromonadales bacterium]|nr:hypothetical protein [Desulfuromonadales bacterium]NIR32998.1 hypothetical protein [Desulfuromonadales bacterium]NIS40547.1 hypothetical protein [Desulfuromonadales bacterium]
MTKRRLLIYILFACAVLLAAAVLFIATFDANRYRSKIEALLSERLEHPVR